MVKAYGLASLPDVTSGREEAKRLTGASFVLTLIVDDGEVIEDSKEIAAWHRPTPPGTLRLLAECRRRSAPT